MTTESSIEIVRVSLATMQREIDELKRLLDERTGSNPKSLRGLWKGVDFTDEEIKEVQRSWMKAIDDFEP